MRLLIALLICNLGFADTIPQTYTNPSTIRITSEVPTPEPDNVQTTIIFPREGEIEMNPVNVQVRLLGFPVGTTSDFERRKEIYNDPEGQSLLIFIDNYHPFEVYNSFVDALDQSNVYFDLTLTKLIPYDLDEGMHVIRTFPARSYGEGLKNPQCFKARVFYIGSQIDNLDVNLNAPYLTYNEPLETLTYEAGKPLLLDFYLSNIQLSQDGYKVKVTIDGSVQRILTSWNPYYIWGLKSGQHTIRLQLLNEQNKVEPGIFNDVQRIITIE
ncbi:MAG: hypothetical protein JSS30_08090 [Verrucomicrobia bacterium]|nr:hypothetical protein [Verrucomicrobiota bacterium]